MWLCLIFFILLLEPVLVVLLLFFPVILSHVYLWHALEDLRNDRGSSKLPSLRSRLVPALLLSKDLNAIFFNSEALPAVILFNVRSVNWSNIILNRKAIALLSLTSRSIYWLTICIYWRCSSYSNITQFSRIF